MKRSQIKPIETAIPAARQNDFRHYGVHPYFTRRPTNVVRQYLRTYSQIGDTVLDPFGGTGVTAVEAYLLGRHAIQNDINPFANFISTCLVDPAFTSLARLQEAYGRVEDACRQNIAQLQESAAFCETLLAELPLPKNIVLPRNSDAERFHDLFTRRQLAGLALIKRAIDAEPDPSLRNPLLLAWSMHKKKNSSSVLGGEMIITFYKPKKRRAPTRAANSGARENSEVLLDRVLDGLLTEEQSEFAHEVLFNKMIIEFWKRDALNCLELNRRIFADKLQQRGWEYAPAKHRWIRNDRQLKPQAQPTLFP